jgi:hypothetical protein
MGRENAHGGVSSSLGRLDPAPRRIVSAELTANLIRESFTFSGLNNSRDRIGKLLETRIAATILAFIIDERCSWQTSKKSAQCLAS